MPAVALAQGLGRLGCFFAGCCYGRETDAWYGITFRNSKFAPNNVKLIPTQLISSAGDFLICGILLFYAARNPRDGRVASAYPQKAGTDKHFFFFHFFPPVKRYFRSIYFVSGSFSKNLNKNGEDVDGYFRAGVKKVLEKIEGKEISMAVLQPRSPSCGTKLSPITCTPNPICFIVSRPAYSSLK